MSRTRHHKEQKHRHYGHDLWSRRPCSGMPYTADNKKLTRQIERSKESDVIRNELLTEQ